MALPTLDAHAHLDPARPAQELAQSGAVISMTFSLEGAQKTLTRTDEFVAWGVGCHPRFAAAQNAFDVRQFRNLVARTAIVGEVGLDGASRVSQADQLRVFRSVLEIVCEIPRFVSIHSVRATGLVLKELRRTPLAAPVLHWWMGSVAETKEALALGCYFSIHPQVARHSKFRNWVPLERVFVESDHGVKDPLAGIPLRIQKVERLVAQQYGIQTDELRKVTWKNLASLIEATDTRELWPRAFMPLSHPGVAN